MKQHCEHSSINMSPQDVPPQDVNVGLDGLTDRLCNCTHCQLVICKAAHVQGNPGTAGAPLLLFGSL